MLGRIYNNINYLEKALDGTWLRNKAIDENIANADTPNYKRKDVMFEDYLREELNKSNSKLNTTNEKHLSGIGSLYDNRLRITEDKKLSYRFDGNNVNSDVENANLAKNYIMYDALTNQLINEYEKIKNAIIEGSK